eukprot:9933738-Alexandrium_andersonii.AAC.1
MFGQGPQETPPGVVSLLPGPLRRRRKVLPVRASFRKNHACSRAPEGSRPHGARSSAREA